MDKKFDDKTKSQSAKPQKQLSKEELIEKLLLKEIEGGSECTDGLCGTPDQSGGCGCGCGCGIIVA